MDLPIYKETLEKKIRIYKKAGRSDAWWEVDRVLQEQIKSSRESFVEKMLEEGNSSKSFYSATRKLASSSPQHQCSVRDVFPGREAKDACSEVLSYFGSIATAEGSPLPVVNQVHGGLAPFGSQRTETLLGAAKKSDSMVKGDPLPNLVRCYPTAFSGPVSEIFNAINVTGEGQIFGKKNTLLSSQKSQIQWTFLNAVTTAAPRYLRRSWKGRSLLSCDPSLHLILTSLAASQNVVPSTC